MIPQYDTKTFCDIFPNAEEFLNGWKSNGLYVEDLVSDINIRYLFYLLYSRYGNNPIANYDEEQFKYKVWAIIFQYCPSWVKRMEIQKNLRELSDEELLTGAKTINNHAFNPSSEPSTDTTEEISYINEQGTTKFKKGKLDAYSMLWNMIQSDVTEELLSKFMKLFNQFATPSRPTLYVTEGEE